MKIVLVHPEIPQNTGNIIRTCAVTGTGLVLVRPLGFHFSDRKLKRAGLDYWDQVDITLIDDLPSFLATAGPPFFFSSHATTFYHEVSYPEDALLIFGSETRGLDAGYRELWPHAFYKIPMRGKSRCLNLANAVSIVLYEGLRQNNFALF